jgi:predicted RNase H-like HicB family nuclease
MQLAYTYWEDKEWYLGYLNQYPEHWTQGRTLSELEEMLVSLYKDLVTFDDIQSAEPRFCSGMLEIAV